jgi:hypothetical protein
MTFKRKKIAGAETSAEIQKIVRDITDFVKHKKPTPRSTQSCSNSTQTSQEQSKCFYT